jgi:hypothetical protein
MALTEKSFMKRYRSLCLDGRRLKWWGGTTGLLARNILARIDSFSRIVANGYAGGITNGIEMIWANVVHCANKAELTMEYGGSVDSRIEAIGEAL